MKDETQQNKLARYSFYIGLTAIMWWFFIFSNPARIGNFYLAISAMVQHAIGLILGIVGLKKKTEKKYSALGIGINAPFILIALLFIFAPFFLKATGAIYVPDKNEITARFSEFLIEPRNIQGISSVGKKEGAVFKYYTQSTHFVSDLEQQASTKGWTEKTRNASTLDFERDTNQTRNGKIILYDYQRLRVVHDDKSGLVCVGYNHMLSQDKIEDFENSDDMKAIRFATWSQLRPCIEGK